MRLSSSAECLVALAIAAAVVLPGCSKSDADRVQFSPYDHKAFEAARAEKKPIVVYVTADWCPGCQKLSRNGLRDPKVNAALASFTRLKVDYSNKSDQRVKAILTGMKIESLPTLVFIDPDGSEAARLKGPQEPDAIVEAAVKTKGP